jgi:bifunctional DNA-binding transcriptional regulator/antitoxin component of YhaV-PrlF toxin-antitoxin module
MCSNQAIAFGVSTIVQAFVATRKMFTAFDVTRELRARVGQGVKVPHQDVREEVHALYRRGVMGSDYQRAAQNIGGNNQTALVYHHYSDNPQAYQLQGQPQIGATATVTAQAPQTAPAQVGLLCSGSAPPNSPAQAQNSTGRTITRHLRNNQYERDSRGRVRVPKSLMAQVGFNAGDTAFVVIDKANDRVSICRTSPAPAVGQVVKPMTSDEYNNLLFKTPLSAKAYRFTANRDSVVMQPA